MIKNNKFSKNIIIYGSKNKEEYYNIASKCDVGLGSLAMYRQNLKEGSTLKSTRNACYGIASLFRT